MQAFRRRRVDMSESVRVRCASSDVEIRFIDGSVKCRSWQFFQLQRDIVREISTMMINGLVNAVHRQLVMLALLAVSMTGLANDCFAQTSRRVVPPAPLGSPNVYVGPVANPFGQPPVPLGSVPAPLVPVQEFGPVPVFPGPVPYPMGPVVVRRPTPFDGSVPAGPTYPMAMRAFPEPVVIAPSPEIPPAPVGNLRLTVSENFLNRLIARDETKPGEVRDFILGAQVSGRQTTATRVRLDLVPSANNARGALVLNGTTQSETTGVTPQAMVDVASQQEFVAVKEIFFDGMKFSTRHAVVHVRAKNQTLGATTPLTGTLFGGIANRIAYREAERRRPQAEAVARDRVAERVFPEFDNTIDKQLATANDQLEGTVRRLMKSANLMPITQQVSTTQTSLSYSAQFATEVPATSSDAVDRQINPDTGLNLLIHESLLNAFVSRSGLKGFKTTDREIKAIMAPYEYKPTGDELSSAEPPVGLPGMDSIVTDIEFDEENPLTIRVEKNSTLVILRAKFKPAGQEVLPALELTIPYNTELIGDKIVVSPGKVRVISLDSPDSSATPSLAMKLVSQGIEANLSKLAVDRALPASLWPAAGSVPRVERIISQDGWAAITVD